MSDPPTINPDMQAITFSSTKDSHDDYFQATPRAKPKTPLLSTSQTSDHAKIPTLNQTGVPRNHAYRPNRGPSRGGHARNFSSNTVLYDPVGETADSSSSPSRKVITARNSAKNSGSLTPVTVGRRTPKRQFPGAARARPIMPPRNLFQSAPDLAGMLMLDQGRRRPSSLTMDFGSDLGDNKAVGGVLSVLSHRALQPRWHSLRALCEQNKLLLAGTMIRPGWGN